MSESLLMVGNFLSGRLHTRGMGEELCARLRARGWAVLTTSSRVGRAARLADMLGTALLRAREYRLALVEVYSGPAFAWAEAVCGLLGALRKPYALVLHGGGLPAFARRHPARIERLLRGARAVVTPSRWVASALSPWRADIRYLPNAIEIANYPHRLRQNPAPRLGWLRAFHGIYRPWVAVETLGLVRQTHPAASLVMIGPDNHDGALERTVARVRELGLEDAITFAGGVSKADVPVWLNRAEIFLNTTVLESFGVAAVEAAACGLPLVMTDVGELPYLWRSSEDALLVPPDDPAAMAAAVRRILDEPDLAERLSRNGRCKAEQFDWAHILPQWEALFEGMR